MYTTVTSPDEIDSSRRFVLIDAADGYPGQIKILSDDQKALRAEYPEYVSRYNVLRDLGMWQSLSDRFSATDGTGRMIYTTPAGKTLLDAAEALHEPLSIDHLTLPSIGGNPGALFPYQQYGLRKALQSGSRFFFFGWGTGTGKGTAACAGAQELFNRDEIDVVLLFTTRKHKINFCREFNEKTQLHARVIDGKDYQVKGKKTTAKQDRADQFAQHDADVYVLNYEKANLDYEILAKRIKGKRVLLILDEVQKVLVATSGRLNKAATGIRNLIRSVKEPYIWPMSATVVNNDPERYWRLFDLPVGDNPLGILSDFRIRYCDEIRTIVRPWGSTVADYEWSIDKLIEVPHRVAHLSHFVRKSDPGVKEHFKDIKFIPVPVQMSEADRKLYDFVLQAGKNDDPLLWGQYYQVLKHICNTPEALMSSNSGLAKALRETKVKLTSDDCAKMETLLDMVSGMQDAGEKVIVFAHHTHLSLFQIAAQFDKAKISYVLHYGTGMSSRQAQEAQDTFKSDRKITVFLTSDAGSTALSFQQAKYVINYDIPYSYDDLTQRNARIDRADSYLDGLTCYGLYNEGTVEERIWKINQSRMELAAAIQGTTEELSRVKHGRSETDDLEYLMWGTAA